MHYSLQDIEAYVHIGITQDEQATPQLLKFGVEFNFDSIKAIKTDDISDTVDYQIIHDTIKEYSQSENWNLLETLHAELLELLKNQCPLAQDLTLSITKFPWEGARVTIS